jgi:hypothetical protein
MHQPSPRNSKRRRCTTSHDDAVQLLETGAKTFVDITTEQPELLREKAFMLKAIRISADALQYADDRLRGERSFMLDAVSAQPTSLRHASKDMRGDSGVVMNALLQYSKDDTAPDDIDSQDLVPSPIMDFVDASLLTNSEFMLEAIRVRSTSALYAHETLLDDPMFLIAALRANPRSIASITRHIIIHSGIMYDVISKTPQILEYAGVGLKYDSDFMKHVLMRTGDVHVLKYASDALLDSGDFIIEAAEVNGAAVLYASQRLIRKNSDIIRNLMIRLGLTRDSKVLLSMIQQNPEVIAWASEALWKDDVFIHTAISLHPYVLKYIPYKYRASQIVHRSLVNTSANIRNDDVFMFDLAKTNIDLLGCASEKMRGNAAVILELTLRDHRALDYINDNLKHDRDFWLSVVEIDHELLAMADVSIRSSEEFMYNAVDIHGMSLRFAEEPAKSHELLNAISIVRDQSFYHYMVPSMQSRLSWLLPVEEASMREETSTETPSCLDDTYKTWLNRSCCDRPLDTMCSFCMDELLPPVNSCECDCIKCTRCAMAFHTDCVLERLRAVFRNINRVQWDCPSCRTLDPPVRNVRRLDLVVI